MTINEIEDVSGAGNETSGRIRKLPLHPVKKYSFGYEIPFINKELWLL
jgi:hypothetical protein